MSIIKKIRREKMKKEYFEAYNVFSDLVNKYLDSWNREWNELNPNRGYKNKEYDDFMNQKFNVVAQKINMTSYSKNLEYYAEDLEFKARVL